MAELCPSHWIFITMLRRGERHCWVWFITHFTFKNSAYLHRSLSLHFDSSVVWFSDAWGTTFSPTDSQPLERIQTRDARYGFLQIFSDSFLPIADADVCTFYLPPNCKEHEVSAAVLLPYLLLASRRLLVLSQLSLLLSLWYFYWYNYCCENCNDQSN